VVPLGLCGLTPEVEYPVVKIEKNGRSRIIVHYLPSPNFYLLPEPYANVVSPKDIEK